MHETKGVDGLREQRARSDELIFTISFAGLVEAKVRSLRYHRQWRKMDARHNSALIKAQKASKQENKHRDVQLLCTSSERASFRLDFGDSLWVKDSPKGPQASKQDAYSVFDIFHPLDAKPER